MDANIEDKENSNLQREEENTLYYLSLFSYFIACKLDLLNSLTVSLPSL